MPPVPARSSHSIYISACLILGVAGWPKLEPKICPAEDGPILTWAIFAKGQVQRYSKVPWRIIWIIMEILAIAIIGIMYAVITSKILLHLPRCCPIVLIFTSGWHKTERSQNNVRKGAGVSKLKTREKTKDVRRDVWAQVCFRYVSYSASLGM